MLRKLGISLNAYYNYLKHSKSEYQAQKLQIYNKIKTIYHETGGILGHRSIRIFLGRKGISLSKTTVFIYINKELKLLSTCRRKRPGYRKGQVQKEMPENLILHSDQGSPFTSLQFTLFCQEHHITQSISRAGCPYDNAPMERYYNSLKHKLINRYYFRTDEELNKAVAEYAYV